MSAMPKVIGIIHNARVNLTVVPIASATAPNEAAAPTTLLLKGISGTGQHRFALINDATFEAMEKGLRALRDTGCYPNEELFNFKEFCSLIGFEEVWAFERTWAK